MNKKELDKLHPEYKENFIKNYENELLSTGSKVEDNPLIKYLK